MTSIYDSILQADAMAPTTGQAWARATLPCCGRVLHFVAPSPVGTVFEMIGLLEAEVEHHRQTCDQRGATVAILH